MYDAIVRRNDKDLLCDHHCWKKEKETNSKILFKNFLMDNFHLKRAKKVQGIQRDSDKKCEMKEWKKFILKLP